MKNNFTSLVGVVLSLVALLTACGPTKAEMQLSFDATLTQIATENMPTMTLTPTTTNTPTPTRLPTNTPIPTSESQAEYNYLIKMKDLINRLSDEWNVYDTYMKNMDLKDATWKSNVSTSLDNIVNIVYLMAFEPAPKKFEKVSENYKQGYEDFVLGVTHLKNAIENDSMDELRDGIDHITLGLQYLNNALSLIN